MRPVIAYYTNKDWIKSFRYKPEYVVVKPIYFKRDMDLLTRFQKVCNRASINGDTNNRLNMGKNEVYNRRRRRRRALATLYKLREECHNRKLFVGAYGGYGEFKIIPVV